MSPQKSKILHLGFYISIVLALVLLVACGPSAPTPAETPKPTTTGPQKYGGLLRITHTSVPRVLGYPGINMGNDTKWMAPCVESLIRIGKDLQPEPLLVESWEVAPDGKIITFKLRKGVKFHDGTDFNSDAVKANMDLQLAAKKGTLANLTSVDVIDPYTVRFNLKQWDFTLLYNLGQNEGIMLSPASLKLGEEAAQFKPVGTGPFKFVSYENDVKVKYTKFDGYWQKGKPYLDGIEIISIANTNTAITSLKAGEVDLLLGTTQASGKLAQDASMPGVIKINTLPSILSGLAPDSRNPDSPLANRKVREAIEYGIDREAIAKALGFGYWLPLYQNSTEGNYAYNPGLGRKYNLEQAKKLLAEAGYANGFSYKLIGTTSSSKDAMAAIQSELGKIGINVQIEALATGAYDDLRFKGWKGGMLMSGMFLATSHIFSGCVANMPVDYSHHFSLQRPPGYAELLSKGLESKDFATLKANGQAMSKLLYDDITQIPMYTYTSFTAAYNYVNDHGNYANDSVSWTPENAWFNK